MMTLENIIKQCRYYKGQKKCPANTPLLFWNYERIWAGKMAREAIEHNH